MKWKILSGLDLVFRALACVTAGVIGNRLLASHVPSLRENANWLSRSVMKFLTFPTTLAETMVGDLSTTAALLFVLALVAVELLLILGTPLADRAIAMAATKTSQLDVDALYRQVRAKREEVRPLVDRIS